MTTTTNTSTTLTAAAAASFTLALTILAFQYGKRCGRSQSQSQADSRSVSTKDAAPTRVIKAGQTLTAPLEKGTTHCGNDEFDKLQIYPIGTLHSIYRLCVGTPRQGMLVPHSRGQITFHEHRISKDSLLELQHYSHVFVVFVFHLNSNVSVRENTFGSDNNTADKKKQGKRQFPSKIAPPSLGGKKVGVFSTRTPHRPNPIGFSLCKLDKVVINNTGNSSGGSTFSLLLSGLDIVDGTPILDIKPYVPHYDCVGYDPMRMSGGVTRPGESGLASGSFRSDHNANSNDDKTGIPTPTSNVDDVRVPHWVDSGLQKRRQVTFLPEANQFLQNLISPSDSGELFLKKLQFYGPNSPWQDSPSEAVKYLQNCMHELLGVDVRSAWQTKKARKGKFQAERSSRMKELKADSNAKADGSNGESGTNQLCTQQIDNLLLKYTIEERSSLDERSKGSGAEDIVVVHSISFINEN